MTGGEVRIDALEHALVLLRLRLGAGTRRWQRGSGDTARSTFHAQFQRRKASGEAQQ